MAVLINFIKQVYRNKNMPEEPTHFDRLTEKVRMINLKWLTKGDLADDAKKYIDRLEKEDFELMTHVCHVALACAREASTRHMDPKPFFYGGLFSHTTPKEREELLRNNKVTSALVEAIEKPDSLAQNLSFMHIDQLAQFQQIASIIRDKAKGK
ncbi:MAG: hypothetical protein SGI98_08165 [Verrucomicrobiota bacterium]|nr:hypothetical protein [Verrucomicrobiota bacterium]